MKIEYSQSTFDARQCRAADQKLFADTMAFIASGDFVALASNRHFPIATGYLQKRLRRFTATSSNLLGAIYAGGNIMALRCAHLFGIIKPSVTTPTVRQTFNRIRAAKGPAAEVCRALLTGEGVPDAVLFRRIIEARRGSPLPVFDLSDDGQPEIVNRRTEGVARAAQKRERDKRERGEPDRIPASKTPLPKAVRNTTRKAVKTPDEVRREICGDREELSERLSYRDRQALERGQS